MTCHFTPTTALHFTDSGQGAPVVLLHGSASTGKQWRSLTDYLSGRFRVITPDLPGYGRSARPCTVHPSLEDTARSIAAIIDQTGEPVHLVGHSFGAAVALKIATLWPEKLRSLTLIEPATFNAFWSMRGPWAAETRNFVTMFQNTRSRVALGRPYDAMNRFIDFWNGAGAWRKSSTGLRIKMAAMVAQVINDFKALSGDTMSEHDLAGVVCPVQILRGDASPAVIRTLSGHLLSKLPFASELVFENTGHMLPLTDPHLVDPIIGRFITEVDRAMNSCATSVALAA